MKAKPDKLTCPQCKNTTLFQSDLHRHRCLQCDKFFSQRVEIKETSCRNRVFNGPFATR